jgi:tetratricopeptide (TPR) repeat protein
MGVAKNKEAAQEFAKLLEKYPDSAVCHVQMGRAQKKAGNSDNAKEHFRRACELDSNCADAFYELGCMQEGDKQYTEAAASFQHFLSLKPEGAARKNIEDRIRFCQQQK